MKKVLIATTNFGKYKVYNAIFSELGIETCNLNDLDLSAKIEENGTNELENAVIKAKAYHELTGLPALSNDSGLIINKFASKDQPKELVRRYNGKELTDQELLNVYIEKLTNVGGKSKGHFVVALALIDENGKLHTKLFKPKRYFINKPSPVMVSGIPLSSLAYDKHTKKYMSEMTAEEMNTYEGKAMKAQKKFIQKVFKKTGN